jgi:hypothetical protein
MDVFNEEKIKEDLRFLTGKGNWRGGQLDMTQLFNVAREWKKICKGHDKLWLCWNVDPEWCLVQQKLVKEMGWTPLVGSDSRAKKAKLIDGAIEINFNENLDLPMFHMVLAVEFAFLYIEGKMAFWHSDLLIRRAKLKSIAGMMENLGENDMLVTKPGLGMKAKILRKEGRYWELVACTTKAASEHQFMHGAGWMSNITCHPMAVQSDKERIRRAKQYYDHGAGVYYWSKNYKPESWGMVFIEENYIDEGHFTRIRAKKYQLTSPNNERRDLTSELALNFDLHAECEKLGLGDLTS